MKTELGMKIVATPLAEAIEELLALKNDKVLLNNRLEQQESKVLMLMREKKQYSMKVGDYEISYNLVEEKHKVKIKKR